MKRIILLITAAVFAFNCGIYVTALEINENENTAYVLLEAETGEILFAENQNERLPAASVAKIMLLLIVSDEVRTGRVSPADSVPAPASVTGAKAPVIWLEQGEVMSLDDLMKAVIINSANDAALALAEYIAGSEAQFTAIMNERASRLGMNNTRFADCTGQSPETYCSARDAAIMTAALFRYSGGESDVFGEYYTTRLDSVRKGTERESQLVNTNSMARWYDGIIGGKAGRASSAGRSPSAGRAGNGFNAVNCAKRGEMRLVAAVMGAADDETAFTLCEQLLDGGFDGFEYVTPELDPAMFSPVAITGGVEKAVSVAPERAVTFIAPRGSGSDAEFELILPESVAAPVREGQTLGRVMVRLGDKTVAQCRIIALHDVEKLTFLRSLDIAIVKFFRI